VEFRQAKQEAVICIVAPILEISQGIIAKVRKIKSQGTIDFGQLCGSWQIRTKFSAFKRRILRFFHLSLIISN